jgi:hypothetical protein
MFHIISYNVGKGQISMPEWFGIAFGKIWFIS